MLQTMRSSAKFVFWILAVAFIGGFLLAETSGLLGSSPVTPTTAVAKVNGRDILYADWQRRSQQLLQQEQHRREEHYKAFRQHWYQLQARDFRREILDTLDACQRQQDGIHAATASGR